MPAFMQKGSNGRQVGMSRSGKGGRGPAVKKIIPSNFEAKVELKKSDNAWVRPSEVSKDVASEESEKEVWFFPYLKFNFQWQDSERGKFLKAQIGSFLSHHLFVVYLLTHFVFLCKIYLHFDVGVLLREIMYITLSMMLGFRGQGVC